MTPFHPLLRPASARGPRADEAAAPPVADAAAELPGAPAAPSAPDSDKAYRQQATQAAQKFEGLMIASMLREARRTMRELSSEDSPFRDRVNDDMQDMADGIVADTLAGQHAFGVADAMLRQILPTAVPAAPAVTNSTAAAAHEPSAQISFKSRRPPAALTP